MAFPVIADITASVKDTRFIRDPFFKNYPITLKNDGQPYVFGGGFSLVFKIQKDAESWAFKVWKQEVFENEERHGLIKEYLTTVNLPYFSDFEYVPKGLLVNGQFIPTLRMPWMEGSLLKHYINLHIDSPDILNALAADFLDMTRALHEHSISHGDLKNDNIFVSEDGHIKLIDYDSICVPKIVNRANICAGTEGYQYPFRGYLGDLASLKADHFSELIIYLSIKAVAEHPLLWHKYDVMTADYRLLFKKSDFSGFRDSQIWQDLINLSPEIQELVAKMESFIYPHLNLLPIGF